MDHLLYLGTWQKLISPAFNVTGSNPTLDFSLYMHGPSLGMLDVSVIVGSDTTSLQIFNSQIQTSKDQAWAKQSINLSAYIGQSIKIAFIAEKMGLNQAGDIAIDTILVYSGPNVTAIPTLSQWGLIILILLLLIVMIRDYGSRVVKSLTVRS